MTPCNESIDHSGRTRRCLLPAGHRHWHYTPVPVTAPTLRGDRVFLDIYTWDGPL